MYNIVTTLKVGSSNNLTHSKVEIYYKEDPGDGNFPKIRNR